MDRTLIDTFEDCTHGSFSGALNFPAVVKRLVAIGAESYHADLNRREKTYYMPDGESHIVPFAAGASLTDAAVANEFSDAGVAAALKAVQAGTITYTEFLRRIMAAGTTAYTVYITGRRAIYVGRRGEHLIERFPDAL